MVKNHSNNASGDTGSSSNYGATTGRRSSGEASPISSLPPISPIVCDPGMQIELSASVAGVVPDGMYYIKYYTFNIIVYLLIKSKDYVKHLVLKIFLKIFFT